MRGPIAQVVDRLFAYGTLLAPELLCRVIGREITGQAAVLPEYSCYRVRRAAYPAIVAQTGATTDGRIFGGIAALEWDKLDAFESQLYDRCMVEVTLADRTRITAYTYVVTAAGRHRLSDEPWELEYFRRHHLERYLRRL